MRFTPGIQGNRSGSGRASLRQVALDVMVRTFRGVEVPRRVPWRIAVSRRYLRNQGLQDADLQALVWAGYLEHGLETTTTESQAREVENAPVEDLKPLSRFWPSREGLAYIARQGKAPAGVTKSAGRPAGRQLPRSAGSPAWDEETGVLSWQGKCVKEVRGDGASMRTVLNALEAVGWGPLKNPLPPKGNRKDRLRRTLDHLNRRQRGRFRVHFEADGQGGVAWKVFDMSMEE